ncbi:MAG: LysR family transcriptional regulator [Pseudomonadota bacterium]
MSVPTQLRALQALELAIRKGSIKAAAKELSLTPAAIGQRIRALEDYLGYELIVRGRTGIRPSREVKPALAHLSAAFRELETVSRLLDFQRVNEIHITADSDWADLWLLPRLAGYQEANPNILFCVNGVGDVPVRLGDSDCRVGFDLETGDALYRDYLLPVTSPENAKRIVQEPGNELEGFPLLHIDAYAVQAKDIGWPEWVSRFGHRATNPERGIRYQWVVQALEAVYANAGFVLCGLSLVQNEINEGKLNTPFAVEEGEWAKAEYQVQFRPDALERGVVQNFRAWLLKEARKTQHDLEKKIDQNQV